MSIIDKAYGWCRSWFISKQKINETKLNFVIINLNVGQLPPFKAEAFCDRVKDNFLNKGRPFPDNWRVLILPTRENPTSIEIVYHDSISNNLSVELDKLEKGGEEVRRIFYIDVSEDKQEEFLQKVKDQFKKSKNKISSADIKVARELEKQGIEATEWKEVSNSSSKLGVSSRGVGENKGIKLQSVSGHHLIMNDNKDDYWIPLDNKTIEKANKIQAEQKEEIAVKEYILLMLGAPVVKVELDDKQLNMCYEIAAKAITPEIEKYLDKNDRLKLIQKGAYASALIILGRIRGKYKNLPGPEGKISLDARELYKEGNRLYDEWESQLDSYTNMNKTESMLKNNIMGNIKSSKKVDNKLTNLMSDKDVLTKIMKYSEVEADGIISRKKIQKLEELKLQVMAQNPSILGVAMPGEDLAKAGGVYGKTNPETQINSPKYPC